MRRGPWLVGRRHHDERRGLAIEGRLERLGAGRTPRVNRHDPGLDGPPGRFEPGTGGAYVAQHLAAAESQIRDADVASEIVNLTKWQVLNQTGLSALAQANTSAQSVLTLLR